MSRALLFSLCALSVVACGEPEPEPEPEVDPPSAPVVGITPATPYTGDDLKAEIVEDSVDPQDLAVNYTFSWSDGGTGGQDGDTLPAAKTARGQTWTVTVTPDNGEVDGPAGTASKTIENSLPTVASATLGPDPAYPTDDLTCTAGATADADGDSVTVHYAWSVGGSAAGTDSATLGAAEIERGDEVTCTVTPDDGVGTGTSATSNAVTIGNRAPSLDSVTVVPQTGSEATSSIPLVCSPNGFQDPDGDSPTYAYAWTVNGSAAGTNSAVLSDSAFTRGSSVICTVTPSDGALEGPPVASDAVTIQNSPPVLASATVGPSPAYTDTELACSHPDAVDPDGEPTENISYFYQWTVNGSPVGDDSPSLTNTALFAKGQSVVCTVTPLDLDDVGLPVASDPLVISNTLPETTSVQIDQTTAYTNTDLTCSAEGDDLDDADSVTFNYVWKVNGAVKGGNSSTLASSEFSKGQSVTCTATAKDPAVGSGLTSDPPLVISDTAPQITSVSVDPASGSTPYTTVNLTCTPSGWSDLDGDAPTDPNAGYTYAWTKQVGGSGGAVSVGGNSATLASTAFAQEDVVRCTVTPYDETDNEGSAQYGEATIVNRLPTITSASITPAGTVYTDTDLDCAGVGWSDADLDSAGYLYAWTKQVGGAGAQIAIGDGTSSLSSGEFDQKDLIRCTVTPDDGFDTGTAKVATKTITNRLPSITSVSISPSPAYTTNNLTCTPAGWSDGDDDSQGYSYAWTKQTGGAGAYASVGSNSSTLLASNFAQTDNIICTVTPNDGYDNGSPVASSARNITNRAPSAPTVSVTVLPEAGTDDLVCTIVSASTDLDGDSLTYTYDWKRNGAEYGDSDDPATVSSAAIQGCDEWTCTASAHDGFTQTASSPKSTFVNSPYVLGALDTDTLDIPAHTTDYSGTTLGLWFTAPYDLTIRGVQVPTSSSSLAQSIEIIRFGSLPESGVSTGDFERLACLRGIADTSNVVQIDPIEIRAGEYVGLLGQRGTTTLHSSYNSAGGWQVSVAGGSAVLNGIISSNNLYSNAPTSLTTYNTFTGRVGLWYSSDTCPAPAGVAADGPLAAYGFCWYLGDHGEACDDVCAAVGGDNLANLAEGTWPSVCSSPPTDADISTQFYQRGNAGSWGTTTGGTSAHTLGYGYLSGSRYGRCDNAGAAIGSFPGESANHTGRNLVCPCFQRAVFGPEHTFAGLTSHHFITQFNCSPNGSPVEDAQYFCQAFYGPTCTPRTGYVEKSLGTSSLPKMHKVTGCTTNGSDAAGTWCDSQQCRIGNWSENTTGLEDLVCECY